LRRGDAHVEHSCDFSKIEAAHVVQKEGKGPALVHIAQVSSNPSEQVPRDQTRSRPRSVGEFGVRVLEYTTLDAPPSNLLADDKRSDPRDPSIERAFAAKTMDGFNELNECQLRNIVDLGVVETEQSNRGRVDLRPNAVIKSRRGGLITRADGLE